MKIQFIIYIITLLFISIYARRRLWFSREGPIPDLPPTYEESNQKPPEIPQAKDHSTLIKNKLLSMVGLSKGSIDKKMESIETVHDFYKNNTFYKIGYVVSFINTTHDGLKDIYKYMEQNKKGLNILKMLNCYEQVVKTNEFLSDMLKILNSMVMRQRDYKSSHKMDPKRFDKNFAWSYYDDDTQS